MVKRRRDENTPDLFLDYQPPEVVFTMDPEVTKGGKLADKISRAISNAMSSCDKSRAEIAEDMTYYLGGQKVTENMLNQYASPERRDHKITLERLIALVHVTECHALLGFVAEFSGFVVVPKHYAKIIQLWQTRAARRKLSQQEDILIGEINGWQP